MSASRRTRYARSVRVGLLAVALLFGEGCVDNASPPPPPSTGQLHIVHVSWTNSHQPADAATCYAHPILTVRFRLDPIRGETVSYAPVPCDDGLFTAEIPDRFWIAEVATIETSVGVPIDATGHATVDLTDWQR